MSDHPNAELEARFVREEQLLDEVVREAASDYEALLTPAQYAAMTTLLKDALSGHPVTGGLIDQLVPREPPAGTTDVAKDDTNESDEGHAKKSG